MRFGRKLDVIMWLTLGSLGGVVVYASMTDASLTEEQADFAFQFGVGLLLALLVRVILVLDEDL